MYFRIITIVIVCLVSLVLTLCIILHQSLDGFVCEVDIPLSHVNYFRFNKHEIKNGLSSTDFCNLNDDVNCKDTSDYCWGYEDGCKKQNYFSYPQCHIEHSAWARTKEAHSALFWEQADFGYIKSMRNSIMEICSPKKKGDSSLRCVKDMRFCHATDIYMDFRNISFADYSKRFEENIFKSGSIGGHCNLKTKLLAEQGGNKSPLQSWFAELESFSSLPWLPSKSPDWCDISFDKPTFLIKLDAGINMYHHFCDFVNLYASQHINGSFSRDVIIIMWDTSNYGYGDFFAETWKAFSDYPIRRLNEFQGKQVCFKDAVFPLLARIIRGLYYNMPLVSGCSGSGLFRAFSEHVLYRLNVSRYSPVSNKFKVVILSRQTKYRNILNEKELLGALKQLPEIDASIVHYSRSMSFVDQLKITQNTDLFIGMHGAGLTHALFLPDWATLFELYNTADPNCYKDLARLRGVSYTTWERREVLFQQDKGHHPRLGAHQKFTNYAFNVNEFMRLVIKSLKNIKRIRGK